MTLTAIEAQIIGLVRDGLLEKEIAERVGISRVRVSQRLRDVKDKFGARTTAQAAALYAVSELSSKCPVGAHAKVA